MPRAIPVLLLAALLLTGCAGASDTVSPKGAAPLTPTPPWSRTDPPTVTRATSAPRTPSDLQPPSNLIVGTITTGGTGPCYVLETDEGKQYALSGDSGRDLPRGTIVRVWFEPATSTCTPGTQVRIVKVEPVAS